MYKYCVAISKWRPRVILKVKQLRLLYGELISGVFRRSICNKYDIGEVALYLLCLQRESVNQDTQSSRSARNALFLALNRITKTHADKQFARTALRRRLRYRWQGEVQAVRADESAYLSTIM